MKTLLRRALASVVSVCVWAGAGADAGREVYETLGIKPADVLNGTVLTTQVLPGSEKQVVSFVTYFTGKRDEAEAVNVRLDVFVRDEGRLAAVWSRDYGKENGGYVARGDVQLVDLDGDGLNEIVASFDNLKDRLIQERKGEVILHEPTGFRVVWSGSFEWDATKAARGVPAERRDRFTREIDVPATLRTRGASLVLNKTVIAVAGERLPEPTKSQESFPLRGSAGGP